MPSSKLTTRRGFLTRPKVCKPPPPPPPPVELPPRTCDIWEDDITLPAGGEEEINFEACCVALPEAQSVSCQWTVTGGDLDAAEIIGNCDPADSGTYEAGEETGDFLIEVLFTWSDTGTCSDSCIVHIEEEDG